MTYEKYLEIYMKYAEKNDVFKILFFGGEPLLNFEEIKKFVDKVSSINPDLNYGIITNGTIMNKK